MDGFRDRMNRGTSERGSYDRYERSSRRSSYGSAAPAGLNAEDVSQIIDDNNAKQLEVINDLFEDAKDDRFESEKQILAAIDDVIAAVADNKAEIAAIADMKTEAEPVTPVAPVVNEPVDTETTKEILRTVNSNADLLAQFAEEQIPMLIRGNSAVLSQISAKIDEKEEILKEILDNSSKSSTEPAPVPYAQPSNNEEVLSAAANNNALLNALRSEVASVQAEVRKLNERTSANADEEGTPLDTEDKFTKTQADEMYRKLEENMHAECVKVYRNVQKVVEDQSTVIIEGANKGKGGLMAFAIINFVLLLLNLAALVLRILDFI